MNHVIKNMEICFFHTILSFEDSLTINADNSMLEAVSIWGALRGLETFSQIVYRDGTLGVNIREIFFLYISVCIYICANFSLLSTKQ